MRFAKISSCVQFDRPVAVALCFALASFAIFDASIAFAQSSQAAEPAEGVLISELPKTIVGDDANAPVPGFESDSQTPAVESESLPGEDTVDVDVDAFEDLEPVPAEASPPPSTFEGTTYDVTRFELDFLIEPPNAPDISELRKTLITLGTMQMEGEPLGVFVPAEQSEVHITFPLEQIPAGAPTRFSGGALARVNQQMVEELSRQGLGSIIVAPDEADIGFTTGEDLRVAGDTNLRLTIFLPTIKEIQSFATGERIPEDEATNNIAHERIVKGSPVGANELFWPKDVDDYVARLNRHPGRRVVAQLSPSHDQQQLYLDYQITETKPWVVYASITNTGAKAVGRWQARAGFVHLQPTNRDDILAFDYVMNTNGNVKAVSGGYELPLWTDRIRLGIDGAYADFKSTTRESLGSGTNPVSVSLGFKGEQARGGLTLAYNVFQYDEYFVDLLSGVTLLHAKTESSAETSAGSISQESDVSKGSDEFLTAHIGAGLERKNQKMKLTAQVWANFNTLNHDTSSESGIGTLGRPDADENPIFLRWDSKFAFFLDALLADPKDPAPIHAHEMVLRYRGQSAFGKYRLIAHQQQVGGGVESVRGYEQGATAGDTVQLASFEYRFHLPRVLNPSGKPPLVPLIGEFAIAPRGPGERPDWDWVLKGFYDFASVRQTDRQALEFNDTLHAVGVGTELFLKRNVQLRLDWAIGLEGVRCTTSSDSSCDIGKHEWELIFGASFFY